VRGETVPLLPRAFFFAPRVHETLLSPGFPLL
jgi:hypothetical protein